MLVDTDVLIWYLRGNGKAREIIDGLPSLSISVVTYMELVQGMRNKRELTELRRALRDWKAKIVYINEEISSKAMFLVERHFLSESMQLADALIASTALTNGMPVLTGNDKHYKVLTQLELKVFRPQ
ncbi:MAG: type II toxin-antitoxin system VapC family toxin [Candidatus Marinimicrobia bacterium]|nr:type II toxin-antitoxin system VapC family toxin [Candidatus Neomarinimicrobiota bacterium]